MKKYVKNYFLIGQKAIITDRRGRILLLRRSVQTPRPGGWDFAGGGLEAGEDPIKGIRREIKEETGLAVKKIVPLIVASRREGKDSVLQIFYQARADSNKVKLSWEHDDYKWFSQSQALKLDLPKCMKDVISSI